MSSTIAYDIVVSLGGSCAVAKQLKFHELRKCSFPFDWLFHFTNKTLEYLIYAFENGFENWMVKENIIELPENERGDSNLYQYKDLLTNYNSIHDFSKPYTDKNEYESVLSKYKRRFKRLEQYLNESKNALFILDARYKVDIRLLQLLRMVVEDRYSVTLDVILLQFNSNVSSTEQLNNLTIYNIQRNHTNEDYNGNPKEWDFLNTISLTDVIFND